MTKRLMSGALIVVLTSVVASAHDGAATCAAAGSTRPIWTFVGIGAGFGAGLWAGLTAFDDSIDSDRKVWTTAIIGAAAGGIIGHLIDRHRAKSEQAPRPSSTVLMPSKRERELISAAGRLGDGQLKVWFATGDWRRSGTDARGVSSIP